MHSFGQVKPVPANVLAGVLAGRGANRSTKGMQVKVEWSFPRSTTCLEGFLKLVLLKVCQYCLVCTIVINIYDHTIFVCIPDFFQFLLEEFVVSHYN